MVKKISSKKEKKKPAPAKKLTEPKQARPAPAVIPVPDLVRKPQNKTGVIKIISWNVNGIRAVSKKGFYDWLYREFPDILCLQETKAMPDQIEKDPGASVIMKHPDYHSCWASAEKKGYSGVGTISSIPPLREQIGFEKDDTERKFNSEGRLIATEYPGFEVWNVYYPNGGRGDHRVQYKLAFYEHCLNIWEDRRKKGKKLILCGDFNTAHHEIDLARPKENTKVSGFLPVERAFLDKITSMGYVDVFRKFNQDPGWYTYWDQITRARERNVGWRIDYFIVTEETMPLVKNASIQMDVPGSDHCPVVLEIEI